MPASIAPLKNQVLRLRDRAIALRHSHRTRRLALIAGILLVLYTLIGFFLVPTLLHRWIDANAGKLIGRPVSVGALQFNPFTLKLGADKVHIGDADAKTPFVDIDRVVLNASWTSLFHWAPVLDEVEVDHPQIALVRTADQRFNFSDILDRFAAAPAPSTPPPTPPEPARFSLSNISVHQGDIHFEDKLTNSSHRVDDIEIGIPFLANLPRDVDVFVQPLLAVRVDGRPLRIEGQTKPFKDSLESTIDLTVDRLDLPQYLAYVPAELPVAIPRGTLSASVRAHFVQDKAGEQLRLDGVVVLDDVAMTDKAKAPIAEVGRVIASFADLEPLISRYRFGNVNLDKATLHYIAQPGGRSNFDALIGPPKPAASKAPPSEVAIANLGLTASRFDYVDATGDTPATLTIDALSGAVNDLNTLNEPAAAVDVSATLNGGSLATRGKLDLPAGRYTGTLSTKDIGIAPLQPFAAPAIQAQVQQGLFDTEGSFFADWKGLFNLHIEPATAHLREVAIGTHESKEPLIAWKALDVALTKFDLASGEARHGDVALHGLSVKVQRRRDGKIDLAALGDSTAAKKTVAAKSTKPAPAWKWSVSRLVLDDAGVNLKDLSTAKPTEVAVKSISGDIAGLSDDMKQPLKLALSGAVDKGSFEINGGVKPMPLDADLKIKTKELNVAGFQPYAEVPLNVRMTQAFLTSDGNVRYADGKPAKVAYRGRVALGRVRVQDKLSGDDFLSFRALDIGTIDYAQSAGPMHLKLGDIALSDFYARVIMNASGRLNLADVAGAGAAQPVSVTRAEGPSNPAPAPQPGPTAAPKPVQAQPAAPAAAIQVGQITLSRGHLNYTDNFIKPNYTANITQLSGKVGGFGTNGGAPAVVTLQGQLDDNAQVNIDGSINPLAPTAFVDIKGKAQGVELTHLSAYSGKYTGYPIIKGRLNADVSYLLDQGKLKADNHINIDQLTFGDEIKDPGVSHLPVKLAVALLKDSDGVIDVNVPVSGSLDDPQFSLGGVVWRAFTGMIVKAVTAPFRLLASAFKGGGGGAGDDLGYVEFAPGADQFDDAAKAKLAQIAKMLAARPSVNLGIIGRVDPSLDVAGLRKVMVDDLIRKEYVHDHGDSSDAAAKPLTPEETDKYLEAAYKHADFPKEKTLVWLTKSQPPDEMRRLLEANVTIDDSSMLHLAERRAGHIVGFLHSKVEDRRLWTLAPKLDAKGIDDQGKTTRVDFTLQ
jgi:uncharacterized protein involved in outer membrane biogenesis